MSRRRWNSKFGRVRWVENERYAIRKSKLRTTNVETLAEFVGRVCVLLGGMDLGLHVCES